MSLYLTVYPANAPNGTSLGTIDAATELQYMHVADGIGSGKVKINRYHAQAALLTQGRYCRVHSDAGVVGAFWLENGPVDLSSFDEEGGEFIEWSGRGSIAILERGLLLEAKYAPAPPASTLRGSFDLPGIWRWSSNGGLDPEYYGGILRRALEEGQNQPGTPLADVTPEFTRALDSSGDAWDEVADEYTTPIGTSTIDLVRQFTGMGIVAQVTPDLEFYAWNRDNFGTVRSGAFGVATVRFEKGVNIADAIQRNIHDWMRVSHLLVEGGDYTYVTVTDPSYPASAGTRWGFLSHEETVDTATLTRMGNENIAARRRRSDVFSFPLMDHGSDPANGLYEPGPSGHFWVGDTITLHTGSETYGVSAAAYQVSSITWRLLENGDYDIIVEIGQGYHWTEGVGGSSPSLCCGPEAPAAGTAAACSRWYFSTNLAGTGAIAQDASWTDAALASPRLLVSAPDDTYPVGGGSSDIFVGVNVPAGSYIADGGARAFEITNAGMLADVQAGGLSAHMQMRARSRNGLGISESSQDDYPTWMARVWRSGTGYIGSLWGLTSGGTRFLPQSTPVNRTWLATTSAVAGAALNDWVIIEWGARHVAPISGGAGAYVRVASATGVADLPVNESETANLNAWIDICTNATAGDTTQPVGAPGSGSTGTGNTYAPLSHIHPHGLLSTDGLRMHNAVDVQYDPTVSLLDAVNVQEAIDEDVAALGAHLVDTVDAHDATAISFTPNGSIAATDVQAAIQEVRDEAAGGGGGVTDHGALTGLADDDHTQYVLRTLLTTRGDLPYRGASDWARRAIGTTGDRLVSDGTDPQWAADRATLNFIIDGGGAAITTGIKGDVVVDFDCTIESATLLADQSGSIVVDIWKDTYANYAPTVADTITAAAKPTLSAAVKSQDTTLTGWTTAISAGQTLRFNVDSITTCQRVTLALKLRRT